MKDELDNLKSPEEEDNGSSAEESSEPSTEPEDIMVTFNKNQAATVIQKFWKKKLAKESNKQTDLLKLF